MSTPLVIVVDDEPKQFQQWLRTLHGVGEIVGVNSSDGLFRVLSKRTVNAVLLDNKLETEKRYRQNGVGLIIARALLVTLSCPIPLVFITGYGSSTTKDQLSSLGATGYFEKPVSLLKVKRLLQKELFSSKSGIPSFGPFDIKALYQAANGASKLYHSAGLYEPIADIGSRDVPGYSSLKVLNTYQGIVEEVNKKEKIALVRVANDDELVEAWFDYDTFVNPELLKGGVRVQYHVTEDARTEIGGIIEIVPPSVAEADIKPKKNDYDENGLINKLNAWLDHD